MQTLVLNTKKRIKPRIRRAESVDLRGINQDELHELRKAIIRADTHLSMVINGDSHLAADIGTTYEPIPVDQIMAMPDINDVDSEKFAMELTGRELHLIRFAVDVALKVLPVRECP